MPTQTTTHVNELKINRLTKSQYEGIAHPSSTELYIVTDEQVDSSELTNKPTIGDATLTIQKNGTTVDTFNANATVNKTVNITIPTAAADIGAVAANTAITGATKCKITYDSKGLVTAGTDLAASDIPNLTLSKISDVTATTSEVNYLSGTTSSVQAQLNSKLNKLTYEWNSEISFGSTGVLYFSLPGATKFLPKPVPLEICESEYLDVLFS